MTGTARFAATLRDVPIVAAGFLPAAGQRGGAEASVQEKDLFVHSLGGWRDLVLLTRRPGGRLVHPRRGRRGYDGECGDVVRVLGALESACILQRHDRRCACRPERAGLHCSRGVPPRGWTTRRSRGVSSRKRSPRSPCRRFAKSRLADAATRRPPCPPAARDAAGPMGNAATLCASSAPWNRPGSSNAMTGAARAAPNVRDVPIVAAGFLPAAGQRGGAEASVQEKDLFVHRVGGWRDLVLLTRRPGGRLVHPRRGTPRVLWGMRRRCACAPWLGVARGSADAYSFW